MLYLIEIPHQTTTIRTDRRGASELYLIEIPHQTTTYGVCSCPHQSCILSKFHIKPQLTPRGTVCRDVVSYRNSTSNHNLFRLLLPLLRLYLIEIPHQTTTVATRRAQSERCILSKFHIKPQPWREQVSTLRRCILSKFHIKPQLPKCIGVADPSCILSKFHIKPQRRASY